MSFKKGTQNVDKQNLLSSHAFHMKSVREIIAHAKQVFFEVIGEVK